MSIKLKVRQGGGTASQPDLANLAEAREGVPVFANDGTALIDIAQRWEQGQSSMGSYTYVDVDGSASYFHRPHAEVKLIEDDSGTDFVLGWGRMEGGNDTGRPSTGPVGHGIVEHSSIQILDCNRDLAGLPFRTVWSRPAETSWERLQALQARSLNGASSTGTTRRKTTNITVDRFTNDHLVTATDPVNMDATDYPIGTTPADVMEDIFSQWEGKRWGVTLHHTDSGTHKCLLVLDADDNDSFPSDLKISDHLADWAPDDPDSPVLVPEWRRGAGKISDNTEVISGLISIWGGTDDEPRSVYVQTDDDEDEWETWVDVYNDDKAKTETQATRRANAILADRKRPYVTPQPSITLNPEQVTLITAGQSIEVKSVVVNQGPDRNEYKWWRIAEIRWEPMPDGRWKAHLGLGRARGAGGANGGGGPSQPGSTSPKPAPECTPTEGEIGDPVSMAAEICPIGAGSPESNCGGVDTCKSSSSGYGYLGSDTTVTPGFYYTQVSAGFKYAWSTPGRFLVRVRDSSNTLPEYFVTLWTGILPHGAYNGSGDCFETIGGSFEVLTGYDRVNFKLADRAFQIEEGTHQFNEFTPPDDPSEDDEFCIPATPGGGSSPFFARSDDPRFDADDQHLTSKIQERVTNNSGGTLAAGDVVIADITYDGHGVTTTTTAATTAARIGIIVEGGDDGEGVVVLWEGVYGGAINIGADTAADGDYLFTSTTAGAASTDATRTTGAFARVIRDDAGDTEYTLVWGVPDSGTSSSSGSGGTLDNWLALHRFLVTANRGYNIADDSNGGTSEPENTMEGFRLSAQVGADGVEADIQQNADGSWVVMHDTTVNRTTTSTGNVNAKTDAQWAALVIDGGQGYNSTRHGSSYSPPFLTDVIDACSAYQVFFMLEVKGGDMAELATFLDDQGIIERTLVVASLTNANSIKAANPAIACMVNYPEGEDEASVDWLSGEYTEWTSLSVVNGVLPQVPHAYIDIADITTDESSILQDMYDRGVRSFESYMISEAVDFRDSAAAGEPTADAHIADTTDAHDASAISIADAGSYYTGTDVEAALQEIGADLATPSSGGGDHDHIVDEQFSGDGSTTTFDLANSAEPETAIAYVAGTRTSVTVGGTLNDQITFAVAPASGTNNISVDYVAPIS